jgi:hypothetical protein
MNTGSEAKFNLSAWALKNQQMVSFFMLLVIAMGVFCYEKLPRNEDPAFTIKTAVVSAQWPGASVADTTRLLTDTLEKSCRKRPGWTISKVKPVPDAPLSTSTSVTIRPATRAGYLVSGSQKNAGHRAVPARRGAGSCRGRRV